MEEIKNSFRNMLGIPKEIGVPFFETIVSMLTANQCAELINLLATQANGLLQDIRTATVDLSNDDKENLMIVDAFTSEIDRFTKYILHLLILRKLKVGTLTENEEKTLSQLESVMFERMSKESIESYCKNNNRPLPEVSEDKSEKPQAKIIALNVSKPVGDC